MSRRAVGRLVGVTVQLVAAVIVTGMLLAAVEFVCGFLVPPPDALQVDQGDYVLQTLKVIELAPELNPSPLAADRRLLWRNTPGAQKTQPINPQPFGHDDTWTIAINTRGFRGPELAAPGAARRPYRVLCVGDSITFGFSVDQGAAYPRRLEAALAARYPAQPFEVINAGVPGWSWVQGQRFLESEGLALRPDVVVIGHGTNDQFFPTQVTDRESIERLDSPVARGAAWLTPLLQQTNTYRAVLQYAPRLRQRLAASAGCRAQMRETGGCRRVSVAEIAETVGAIRRLMAAAGVDLIVLNVDFVETVAVQGTRQAVEANGLVFLDFVQRFHELRQAGERARAERLHVGPGRSAGTGPWTPASVVLRVLAPPGGTMSVKGGAYFSGTFVFDEHLHDDGTRGDEVAGDGVYTSTLSVPGGVAALEYKFFRGDDPEFLPLPPVRSSTGYRLLRLGGDTVGPVEMFGVLDRMAERTHPNAEGQQLIADTVGATIETLPSFRRIVGSPNATVR